MFVFIKATEGISKNTNKEYQVLTLAQYVESKGKVKVRIGDFFPEKKLDLTQFDFGDIVECEFREPEFMGDYPKLIDVQVKFGAPYIDILKRFNDEKSEE